uniref:Piezo-type mechanosensitive ion channel component 2 n=1 Tax=Macrostomum lignano TaxID=282301 RepID=A0A1I8IJZ5_9PLAT
MAETHTILLLCKGLIQVSLFFGSLIRYNVFSFVYLLFLLISPFASFDNRGCFLAYNLALIVCSASFSLCHVAFQIVLGAHPPYGSILADCEADLLWRQVGLQPLHRTEFYHIARLLCPEPLTLLLSAGMFGAIWRHRAEFFPAAVGDACPDCGVLDGYRRNLRRMGDWLMFVLFLALMCTAAICLPCLLSSVYLLSFLLAALLWTAGRLHFRRRGLRWQRRWLALYTACHLASIFLYQFPASQKFEGLRANSTTARLLGLHYLIQSNCSSAQVHFANTISTSEFASPLLILVFYFYLALQIYLHDRGPYRADVSARCPMLTVSVPGCLCDPTVCLLGGAQAMLCIAVVLIA